MSNSERILEFDINKQRMTKKRSCDFSHIVAGTAGYLKAKFYFSKDEWEKCRKAASFWVEDQEYAELLDENNMCTIPKEVLTGRIFEVSVSGRNDEYVIRSNKVKVRQEVS